ncbi:MAG: SDR family oxidoreductase [Brevundimonas sp.]|nr:SDR family oxidoreductase [Brevundimonas sp.]
MRILILGVSGMLGSTTYRLLSQNRSLQVWGTERGNLARQHLSDLTGDRIRSGVDVEDWGGFERVLDDVRPDAIINCVGVVKQLASAKDPLVTVPINTLLPHRLFKSGSERGFRLVHVSTDCVFMGKKGGYTEQDVPDARDLYGLSKYLGEVDEPGAVTLRTSIIGHELATSHSLLCWFLSQRQQVRGFTNAVFSGLPTVELARVISDFVLPNPDLHGLYHVSADAISKFNLLNLFAAEYGHNVSIEPDDTLAIDRSLNSARFYAATGYQAPNWPDLVARMRRFEEQGTL